MFVYTVFTYLFDLEKKKEKKNRKKTKNKSKE